MWLMILVLGAEEFGYRGRTGVRCGRGAVLAVAAVIGRREFWPSRNSASIRMLTHGGSESTGAGAEKCVFEMTGRLVAFDGRGRRSTPGGVRHKVGI